MQRLLHKQSPTLLAIVAFCLIFTVIPAASLASQPPPVHEITPATVGVLTDQVDFWPALTGSTLTWFAIVVILVLTFQFKPLLSERNLDGLVLAATCLLLALRTDSVHLPNWAFGQTGQWWSYLLLSVAAAYWLLRGLLALSAHTIHRHACNVSSGALFILIVAGLAIGITKIATEPLSAGSQDGIVGGLYTAETGMLPYGEVSDHDSRSPGLYLLHAGAVRLLPPEQITSTGTAGPAMSWENRSGWIGQDWWRDGDFACVRLANGLLFVAMLVALYIIGRRLHSAGIGLTMLAVFCVFPGALECLTRPEIMLPATLLGWSIALVLIPGVGGLLSTLVLVLAGTAWPWAWLGLPVLWGYFFRNGWQAFSSLVGFIGGIVAILAGLTWLTLPNLPRADGALYRAGLEPSYVVDRGDDDILRVTQYESVEEARSGLLRPFWKFLINSENLTLDTTVLGPDLSQVYAVDDIDTRSLLFNRLDPTVTARAELARRYRTAMELEPTITRVWVGLRTMLEQTWLSATPPLTSWPGTWALWSQSSSGSDWWPMIRKITKIVVGLLSIIIGLVLLRRQDTRPVHLMGGLLVMSSATLFVGYQGAVVNLVWLMPAALAVWAAHHEPPPKPNAGQRGMSADRLAARLNPIATGPAPRITVED